MEETFEIEGVRYTLPRFPHYEASWDAKARLDIFQSFMLCLRDLENNFELQEYDVRLTYLTSAAHSMVKGIIQGLESLKGFVDVDEKYREGYIYEKVKTLKNLVDPVIAGLPPWKGTAIEKCELFIQAHIALLWIFDKYFADNP
jgi:hypothetical protein